MNEGFVKVKLFDLKVVKVSKLAIEYLRKFQDKKSLSFEGLTGIKVYSCESDYREIMKVILELTRKKLIKRKSNKVYNITVKGKEILRGINK